MKIQILEQGHFPGFCGLDMVLLIKIRSSYFEESMQRIGIVLKQDSREAFDLGCKIAEFLNDLGKEILIESQVSTAAAEWKARPSTRIADESDLLVVLGGDGTILRAASLLNEKSMPILGINLGRVGFMAEILPDEALDALRLTLDGHSDYITRMMLQITLPGGRKARVLNEAVIHWGGIARLIDLGVKMGNSKEIELRADGLIVATPIGSSAYSYAAGGPLVHPDLEGIILTPICPYAGLKRPVIIPPQLKTEILLKKGADLTVTLDGHTTMNLLPGQSLTFAKAPFPFVMVRSNRGDYFDVLKHKLGLLW